jgi:hypothetical protein
MSIESLGQKQISQEVQNISLRKARRVIDDARAKLGEGNIGVTTADDVNSLFYGKSFEDESIASALFALARLGGEEFSAPSRAEYRRSKDKLHNGDTLTTFFKAREHLRGAAEIVIELESPTGNAAVLQFTTTPSYGIKGMVLRPGESMHQTDVSNSLLIEGSSSPEVQLARDTFEAVDVILSALCS